MTAVERDRTIEKFRVGMSIAAGASQNRHLDVIDNVVGCIVLDTRPQVDDLDLAGRNLFNKWRVVIEVVVVLNERPSTSAAAAGRRAAHPQRHHLGLCGAKPAFKLG